MEAGAIREGPAAHARRAAGSCFGYEVTSDLHLRYLRDGSSGGAIEVVEDRRGEPRPAAPPVREWLPRPGNPLHARLFEEGSGFALWIDGVGWYRVNPIAPTISVPATSPNPLRREEHAWGIPAALCLLERGDLPIHAAAVAVDDAAILLAAPGRFGKTTLAAAFLGAGHRLLAEDIGCLRVSPEPQIVPGPAMLRVRRDVFDRLGVVGASVLWEEEERAHLAIDPGRRGDGSPVPLRGIVFLRSGDGEPTLEPVRDLVALPDLWTLVFSLPSDDERVRRFQGIADVAARVPIWNLRRRLEFDQLDATVERIVETCLKG
jgi:hypothetical protein